MSKNNDEGNSSDNNSDNSSEKNALPQFYQDALLAFKKSNKHARKRNRLAKLQYQQSVLNYEQVERQYLIEKSKLQPTFRLSVTEFLMSEPDSLNDPVLANEAKYLSEFGVEVDDRVLRFRVSVKGDAEYRRPSLVITKSNQKTPDERSYSMSDLLYFTPVQNINIDQSTQSFEVYFVYRDSTTLPVIHKFRIKQQLGSTLSRWDVAHLDTVYASSNKSRSSLDNSYGCAKLFAEREKTQ